MHLYRLNATNRKTDRPRLIRRLGAQTVEFAVVSLVFLTMVLGIIEMARALMVSHILAEASRRGCRAAAIEGTSNTDAQSAVDGYMQNSGVSGYSATVLVNDAVANASTANPLDELTVKITVPMSSVTWLPGMSLFFTGALSQQYTLRRE